VSAGIVSRSFSSGLLIFESEDEIGGNFEGRSEKEELVSVAIVRDGVFPSDEFVGWLPSSTTFYYSGKKPGDSLGFVKK
jgi:hypothetical protein